MPKLTDTQTIVLTRAASRPGNLAMPLPKGLAGAAAKMAVSKMIERGWLEEVDANRRHNEPLWRETGDGHGTTLIATEAGLDAIGIDPVVASTVSNIRKAQTAVKSTEVVADAFEGPKLVSIRQGTKQALLIEMLQRPEGASITEIVEATSWQAHTARGAISGALKKKLGLAITSDKHPERGTVYKLAAA
ncbi:DUF3489 domain-containing protein [Thalassobacter stenotrophicus]|uniref:DUF3489 domain-containing protein n=1 Tax=Thalassobacter stenotrophicus TaxID=266809 RepID=UPI0022A8FF5E|nr:DUF3489 domain-containing protein [Thalassobacter stenotrophicus]UYP67456.1 DUF3489 domain-containing protein [Thalassobacter stenotrophicus]